VSKKSIIFIEPGGNETNVFENYMHLPLTGTLYLGTILHNAGYQVKIYNECILSEKIDPFNLRADVFCITSLTVSANRAKFLAGQLRGIYPESTILIGGIHASLAPEEFTDLADHVVIGEAEGIIVDLVEGKFTDKIVRGTPVDEVESLPLLNYGLLEGKERMNIIPIMTSRGCPFDCNFCTVTKIFGKRFRMQSAGRVIAEIKNALTYFKTRTIFFYDDNFTSNRKRVEEICDLLEKENIDITWSAQVRSDIARDPELLSKMARNGARWFYIGFESISDVTLKAMHKSQTKSDIENAIKIIHRCGINIHGMFIFGEDNDTPESLRETADFAVTHDIDTVQFMILTPFPGTQLYDMFKAGNRIYHEKWDYYNGMYAVYRPKNMSASRLQAESLMAYKRFYSLPRLFLDILTLCFSVCIDGLVWNFKRVAGYSFDIFFIQAGAQFLLNRFAGSYNSYLRFLADAEMKHLTR
jgi:radical SAM superfamily enzyme YgiQ (UPF0313 family)